ncbi:MAG: HPP family protein [Limisphaerales bacterium]
MRDSRWRLFLGFIGLEPSSVTHTEKLISGLGAFLGILSTFLISRQFLDTQGTIFLVSSMGASAVLLFGVPHGALSQPWPLLGGHLCSALVGVACSRWIIEPIFAASLAVGMSMLLMHYARCIHPPGGATALTAVIGGTQIQQLGFAYLLFPVALNVFAILLTAFLFNALFKWRRYPACLAQRSFRPDMVPRESLHYALRQMDSFIDVSEEDLEEIYKLATKHAQGSLSPVKTGKEPREKVEAPKATL